MLLSLLKRLGIAATLLLAACQPQAASPIPTLPVVRVQFTPAAQPLTARLHACAAQVGAGLVVDETPAGALDPSGADFALRLGVPAASPGFLAQVGQDEIVVIVPPDNPVQDLSLADLQGIFSGKIKSWDALAGGQGQSGGAIQVWAYPPGDDLRAAFDVAVLGNAGLTPLAYPAPDPAAMLQAVASNPGAIGYVLKSELDASVRSLPLSDVDLSAFEQPVLAISQAEPQGVARALLVCMQESQ